MSRSGFLLWSPPPENLIRGSGEGHTGRLQPEQGGVAAKRTNTWRPRQAAGKLQAVAAGNPMGTGGRGAAYGLVGRGEKKVPGDGAAFRQLICGEEVEGRDGGAPRVLGFVRGGAWRPRGASAAAATPEIGRAHV